MTIEFKTIKFKHYRQAQKINKMIASGEITDEDILRFAASLVKSWDFVDADTGEALPPGLGALDELSMTQCAEVNKLFADEVNGVVVKVPKANAEPSPSTSTLSSPAESPVIAALTG